MKKNLVWLASYPKSGNTWTRIFLANYLTNSQEPVSINQARHFGIADVGAEMYHRVAGRRIDTHDVPLTLQLREGVLRGISNNNADVNLVKTHSICQVARGVHLISYQYTRSAIYVMRNPLDMVMSYARHFALSIEGAATSICSENNFLGADDSVVPTFLGTWSDHVNSWTAKKPYPTLVLRYEDMLERPEEEFSKVVEHFGMTVDPERLDRAIRFSSFKELKKQEKSTGFVERPEKSKSFFTKGQSGHWKDELPPELIDKIIKANRQTMKRFGYLDE
ncbi:sulfotransferase domain-containing protein [Roseovarius sp. A21]|uniref:Sulfotransferase domain-containing protein n=1 Tax=Roseovarius bejariae TaxID=2576383 RepID=A0A844CR81_9RHOB|nr:sulfotransferase domain-containing protein [Roseovarius bejariae]MRU14499.1 sulfotransferase domain-containing protein [Roseovarius bejariae]